MFSRGSRQELDYLMSWTKRFRHQLIGVIPSSPGPRLTWWPAALALGRSHDAGGQPIPGVPPVARVSHPEAGSLLCCHTFGNSAPVPLESEGLVVFGDPSRIHRDRYDPITVI